MNIIKTFGRIFIVLAVAMLIVVATFSLTKASGAQSANTARSTSSVVAQSQRAISAATNAMQLPQRAGRNTPSLSGLASVVQNFAIISVIVLPFALKARRKQARKAAQKIER